MTDTGLRQPDQAPSRSARTGHKPHNRGWFLMPTAGWARRRRLRHNADVAWISFDPEAYWRHNYAGLRPDDAKIIAVVAAFFSKFFTNTPPWAGSRDTVRTGLDVGSGANLYPAMSMLPFCDDILVTDHSASNVTWLKEQLDKPHDEWSAFWQEFVRNGYDDEPGAMKLLQERTRAEKRSVLDLPAHRFDIGTMFFVAESMTNYPNEFEDATARFLAALIPGAPFAAAFMDSSQGYVVGDKSFPAVRRVNLRRVRVTLRQLGANAQVTRVPIPDGDPLRDGYKGMIIAVGTTRT